jgi:hypothetical protein
VKEPIHDHEQEDYRQESSGSLQVERRDTLRQLPDNSGGDKGKHLAKDVLRGLEGDVRVTDKALIVTYYNAPEAERFRGHYQDLPARLRAEGIDPHLPWLYGYQLDFRFR